MLDWNSNTLDEIGASITTREIVQQPKLWEETLSIFNERKEGLTQFLDGFNNTEDKKIRVIFTGAGTSA